MLNWDERDVNTVSHGDVQKSTVPVVVKLRGQGRVKCVCHASARKMVGTESESLI